MILETEVIVILGIITWIIIGDLGFSLWKYVKLRMINTQNSSFLVIDIKYLFYNILPMKKYFVLLGLFGFIYSFILFITYKLKEK